MSDSVMCPNLRFAISFWSSVQASSMRSKYCYSSVSILYYLVNITNKWLFVEKSTYIVIANAVWPVHGVLGGLTDAIIGWITAESNEEDIVYQH